MSKIYPFPGRSATTNCDFASTHSESEDSPERDVQRFRGWAVLGFVAWLAVVAFVGGAWSTWSAISAWGSEVVVDQSGSH